MTTNMIVGSGPAAAAAALALVRDPRQQVLVIDLGAVLEEDKARLLAEVRATVPDEWSAEARRELTKQPIAARKGELPQKTLFGSDFPFRDLGQRSRLRSVPGGNPLSVSAALGGFSNSWGAQIMPFTDVTFDSTWPISAKEMAPHYSAILEHIPLAGAHDDYGELFPLFAEPEELPPLAPASDHMLRRYRRNRRRIREAGVTIGRARLAMQASECMRVGLCLTGCPYNLIYSASSTVRSLVREGRIRYVGGRLGLAVGEDSRGAWLRTRAVDGGPTTLHRADRLYLACGGLGTTQIVVNSVRRDIPSLAMAEAVQFVLPFVSRRRHPDPRHLSGFTLNQVNMAVEYGRPALDLAHLHFYPYNPAFEDGIPNLIAHSELLRRLALSHTTAALGYLPSWHSPAMRVQFRRTAPDELPDVRISSGIRPDGYRTALRGVLSRLLRVAPRLDLYPVLPMLRVSGPGKSYHFGGSFPHVAHPPRAEASETDSLGRLAGWRRVHLIDGSVFPNVPATTFTLTVMANAHRIASCSMWGDS